jgi:hypothetical protein
MFRFDKRSSLLLKSALFAKCAHMTQKLFFLLHTFKNEILILK